MSNFNSVFKGNTTLENQLYHTVNLSYYKFSLFRNLNLHLNTSFNKKVEQFKNVTLLQGIDQYSTPIMLNLPEHIWSVNGLISKKINKIRYKLQGHFRYNDFYQILNNETHLNESKTVSTTVSAETFFKKFPNIEIGYKKDFNAYKSFNTTNNFENNNVFVNAQYDFLNDFIFKADYAFDNYHNISSNTKHTFDTANASLFYQLENSPWGFEINATNLFNTRFKQQNSFNSFLISDIKTYILPRIIMFKVAYKL